MQSILKGLILCTILTIAGLGSTQATSFDCEKANSYAEKTICASAPLQRLDEELNSEYVKTLGRMPDQAKGQVRQAQREWLKRRDACKTPSCVSVAITDQIRALAFWGIEQGVPKQSPESTYQPQKSEAGGDHQPAIQQKAGDRETSVVHPKVVSPAASTNAAESTANSQPFKIALVAMILVLLICIWLHSRGSMTIYQDYTDALWTTVTPILSVGAFFLVKWLEFSDEIAAWIALAVLVLMGLQILVQTYRSNGPSLYFLLSLYAKVVLFTLYLFLMILLLLGGTTKTERRRRRGWAIAASVMFAFFTAWICRNRQFSHIDDYLAGRT
ncbi:MULTISPECIES: lysozyme inhibitor LprI family protein [unclassified Pseudomonas]|uniref:lysozyme inhibitor LprI family protein n=1 Tax=unclassified Pseudomonas TaxID=196821 RepID=UPI0009F6FAFA|nr:MULTISPECIES: lysozyme inhibitor LprI family protein [unclassified Pseudomonas]QOF85670.1 DUF1311 domain-containing protein [Pseudomonas sp. ADPe]